MVETHLTPELMSEGAALVAKLDSLGVSPDAAFWIFFPDIGGWKLLLAESKLGTAGPKEVYREVQKALTTLRNQIVHLSLEDVSVAKPNAPVVQLLRQMIATGPGIHGIRVSKNMINGVMIDDAYIYRLKKPAA
jgi:hypothetical protein